MRRNGYNGTMEFLEIVSSVVVEEMPESSIAMGCRRSRVVTFNAIRLRGPGFKPRSGQKFEKRKFLLQAHPSGGEGVSPMQGEAN